MGFSVKAAASEDSRTGEYAAARSRMALIRRPNREAA
jgi:hypothetical protein